MPDYELRLWNEDSFDLDLYPYAREAYDNRKFAFVTDMVDIYGYPFRVLKLTQNTYCIHHFAGSWVERTPMQNFKLRLRDLIGVQNMNRLVELKRKINKILNGKR